MYNLKIYLSLTITKQHDNNNVNNNNNNKKNTIIVTIIKIGLIIMKIIMAMEMQEMITIESIINNTNMEEQHQMQYED